MMTADELKNLGAKLCDEFKQYLSNRPNEKQIEWCDSIGSGGQIAKLMSIFEDDRLDYDDVLNNLHRMYANSGLQNKLNGKILISELSFTPAMVDPNDTSKIRYGIMVKYQYTYDTAAPKAKRDPLDRY